MVKAITRLALLCLVLITVPVEATGPAQPAITITQAPICGVDDDVMGQTFNVVPADYEVAVYIWVGVWWTKTKRYESASTWSRRTLSMRI